MRAVMTPVPRLTAGRFGLVVTVTVAAISALVPRGRCGEAIGYFGLCALAPTVLGPPLALLLLDAAAQALWANVSVRSYPG